MKTYDVHNKEGQVFAFEVRNLFLGRRGLCKVLESIPGAKIKKTPRFLSWFREEDFCEFELEGITFVAGEPFGDSSRYWIGQKTTHQWCPQIERIRAVFSRHRLLFKLIDG